MIRLSIFLFSLFVLSSCVKEPSCKDFHTGTFEYQSKDGLTHYRIVQMDSIQKEYNLLNGDSTAYRIEWLSPCKYTLEMIEGKKEYLEFFAGQKLHVEIIRVYRDSFMVQTSMNNIIDSKSPVLRVIK